MRKIEIQSVELRPSIVSTSDPLIISAVVVEIIPALLCSDGKYIQTSNNRCIEVTEGAA